MIVGVLVRRKGRGKREEGGGKREEVLEFSRFVGEVDRLRLCNPARLAGKRLT